MMKPEEDLEMTERLKQVKAWLRVQFPVADPELLLEGARFATKTRLHFAVKI